ncbi:Putative zinc-or iron-chelating domain-containing protein [Thermosyntropha lipolytica DSM 11003]|uniref:Putative zinc-or iron-chelating domain-containing protein n=1 Tax=Thermosyntropha lipolytica DSM 11003 TaxID=1123382 RepID=A0A1M5KFS4_9FIRM|nr:YkgJ family cysteine cluster protein [Thermosyntropha lipolytica]SHG51460.1 Putative zinc-or iron-chelating domain-containing protein [Thermosyntropha lipolytica DSM 11003]
MKKVEVTKERGKIKIARIDRAASLKDLLDAWQPLCDDKEVAKLYADESNICKGCKINCCHTAYVIPDIIAFKKLASFYRLDYRQFISIYFQEEKVKRGILRLKPEPCIFLEDNICSVYPLRTLLCRFYLCSEIEGNTEELIWNITWTGIAATQVFARQNGLLQNIHNNGLTSFDLLFKKNIDYYAQSPNVLKFMQAEGYEEIMLRDFRI